MATPVARMLVCRMRARRKVRCAFQETPGFLSGQCVFEDGKAADVAIREQLR
jgi:hypothetical protein